MSEEATGAPEGVEVMPRGKAPARRRQAVAAYVPPDPANPTPAQMLMLAVSRGDSIEQLQQLMDLQDRWDGKQARRAFDAAIAAAKAEIKPIVKRQQVDFLNRNNTRTAYRHEGMDDIAEHVDPILARHGLSYRHRPKQEEGFLTITCILAHVDGHSEETPLRAPYDDSGNKSPAQSVASTGTLLQRYTLKLALGLATTKDDDGQAGREGEEAGQQLRCITHAQVKALEDEVKRLGADRGAFLRAIRCDEFGQILAENYDRVMTLLREKKGMAGGKGGTTAPQRKSAHTHASPELDHAARITALAERADREGVAEGELLRRYNVPELFHLTFEQIDDAERWLGSIHGR
jgi:hypothetical protein